MIAVIDKSTIATTDQVKLWTYACAGQLRRHVGPLWNRSPVPVIFYPDETHVPPGAWSIFVMDDPDQANALGYHSLSPGGLPYGRIFVRPSLDNGVSPSSVLSHEVVEAFIDPTCDGWRRSKNGTWWALEVCDPVESDTYQVTYQRQPVMVSNFVGPKWFDRKATKSDDLDFMGTTPQPFKLAKGGYAVKIKPGETTPTEVFAEAKLPDWKQELKSLPELGSRTSRRMLLPELADS